VRAAARAPGAAVVAATLATVLAAILAAAPARAADPVSPVLAAAPEPPMPDAGEALRFDGYMAQVLRNNLDLVAQRFNVPVAEAQIAIAKIFPDPTLSAGLASFDLERNGAPTAVTASVSETIELGGKRGARVATADEGAAGARADLDDFLRGLRASAAGAFIDALHARLVLGRKALTLASLQRLVHANEERRRAGDIGEVPVMQSRVEAQRFRSEVVDAEADVRDADLGLALQMGRPGAASFAVAGELRATARTFDLDKLIAEARDRRPDVLSRRHALTASHARVDLARANRWIDLTLSLDWVHTAKTDDSKFGPTPAFDALGGGLSLPLPFSHVYKGELQGALAGESEADWTLRSVELKAEVDVRQAFEKYKAAGDRVNVYAAGVLTDADKVLDGTLYSYQRGAATLLEVLEAQRTDNEVHLAYFDALADCAHALVALEQAAGIWDVAF
jgi:cobalt-zinc-cadmium efflux system outer membrane protein